MSDKQNNLFSLDASQSTNEITLLTNIQISVTAKDFTPIFMQSARTQFV
jgi:hypothetical protein